MKFRELRKLIVGYVNLYDANDHFIKGDDVMFLSAEYNDRIVDCICGAEESIDGAIVVYLK